MLSWAAIYLINIFTIIWTVVIGIGWGAGQASQLSSMKSRRLVYLPHAINVHEQLQLPLGLP
jgi:hypothetical protein